VSLLRDLVFCAAVLLALIGWGRLVELAARGAFTGAAERQSVGVSAALGLATALGLFGFLTAFGAFSGSAALILLGAGYVGLVIEPWVRPDRLRWPMRGTVVAGATLLLLATLAPVALSVPLNACDDYIAYIPFADRLLQTGDLIEPFSHRRIASLGGESGFQAVFGHVLGYERLHLFDIAVCGSVVGLLLLTDRKGRAQLALAILFVGTFVLWNAERVNLSPTYSAVALLAATLVVACRSRDQIGAGEARPFLYLGLLCGGVLSLRVSFVLPAVILSLMLAILVTRGGWRPALRGGSAFAGTMLLTAAGWMWALWRSSETPVYPPFAGTLRSDWPGLRDPGIDTVGDRIRLLGDVLFWHNGALVLVALTMMVLVIIWIYSDQGWVRFAPSAFLGAVLVTAVLLTIYLSAYPVPALHRYLWPLLAALAVGAVSWMLDASGSGAGRRNNVPDRLTPIAAVIGLSAILVTQFALESPRATPITDAAIATARLDHASAQSALPRDAGVLVATDFPWLFELNRNEIRNLDTPGSNSPDPGLPYFLGARRKAHYLTAHGIEYVVFQDPERSACYSRAGWRRTLRFPEVYLRQSAPYFLDWFSDLDSLRQANASAISQHGDLLVIDLNAVEAHREKG
jgi:hypothetical protein